MPKLQQLVFWKSDSPTQEPYTTSEVVADVTGIKRHAINQLIKKHKADFEEFGIMAFEMPKKTGRGRPERSYRLNEQQATLLMTYVRNTDTVLCGRCCWSAIAKYGRTRESLQRRYASRRRTQYASMWSTQRRKAQHMQHDTTPAYQDLQIRPRG